MPSLQEAKQLCFNGAWRGMALQGWKKSVGRRDDDGSAPCFYRGPDGRCCPAGWLIPKEKYKDWFEARVVTAIPNFSARALPEFVTAELDDLELTELTHFIAKLQTAHDAYASRHIAREFRAIAKHRRLRIPRARR